MSDQDPGKNTSPLRPMVYEPKAGELFAGRYRIEELLGRGAAGSVWSATDEGVGDRVALKLLVAGPDNAADRFRREVRLARRVTHRNTARIFDLGTLDGVLYLTMELIEGESLEALLKREPRLSIARACETARQIALGLAAAHEVGIIHRDIKPANILLETGGRVVVTDFGIARAVANDAQLTAGAAMIGTPSYMAPEQVRGGTIGPQTDLYALGAVLFEMLTGSCPFVEETAIATAMARLERDPVDPREIAPVPSHIATLVNLLLGRDAETRPASAAAVAQALEEAMSPSALEKADTLVGSAPAARQRGSQGPPPAASASPGRTLGAHSAKASPGSTFVSIAPEERTLAVLPFRIRGSQEHAYLAESLAEDLVDILTTTRGLRVAASGATAKYEGLTVDPREAGQEIGVDAIVDGTVQTSPGRIRFSARLIDVATGEQLWVGKFEGDDTEDVVDLQETTAKRIAESLRLELELLSARHLVPEEAITLLLEARQQASASGLEVNNFELANQKLDQALAIAPGFQLALAAQAEYTVRRWFRPAEGGSDDLRGEEAHRSVEKALKEAPDIALSHLAAGRLAVSDGRFHDAAIELVQALTLAPTFATVHDYLGMLQCEAGRGEEGARRIRLASKLDPSIPLRGALARRQALAGDLEAYREIVSEMKTSSRTDPFTMESLEMRVAGWFGDVETVKRFRPGAYIPDGHEAGLFMDAHRAALLGECEAQELKDALKAALTTGMGPRLEVFIKQLTIEALAPLGDTDGALEQLRIVADSPAFLDADWFERCPALDTLRDHPDFATMMSQVRRRADAIWRVQTP